VRVFLFVSTYILFLSVALDIAVLFRLRAQGQLTSPVVTLRLLETYVDSVWRGVWLFPGAFLCTWVFQRGINRRPLRELGLGGGSHFGETLAFGTLLGLFLMTTLFVTLLLTGHLRFIGPATAEPPVRSHELGLTLYAVLLGLHCLGQVLVAQGYVLHTLAAKGSWAGPLLFTATTFALLHGLNFHLTLLGVINVFLLGLLLGYLCLLTQSLWATWGCYWAWSYACGVVYSLPVRGINGLYHLLQVTLVGDTLLTGGSFGPEGGLYGTAILLLGLAIVSYAAPIGEEGKEARPETN